MKITNPKLQKIIQDNTCINCDNIIHEDLRKWFKQKWVNIAKTDKGGKHPPCGTSGEKRGYAKCVPASKARSMSKKEKESAVRRKRQAQRKAGRAGRGKAGQGVQGKKPIMVKSEINEKNIPTNPSKWSYYKSQAKKKFDVYPSAYANAWAAKMYKKAGGKWKTESYDVWNEKQGYGYTLEFYNNDYLNEAEYQGRKVKLNKPMQGDVKKFKVYVKNPKGNVVKVNFGAKGMKIKKSNPARRRSFRARHNCDTPGPKHKARYWSCKKW